METRGDIKAFFTGQPKSLRLFQSVAEAVAKIGEVTTKVTKSQIAFRRKRGFAYCWRPDQYLHGERAPLVLSVALKRRDKSKRWKEIAEPAPGRFMHHLELHRVKDVDAQVRAWLAEAYDLAG